MMFSIFSSANEPKNFPLNQTKPDLSLSNEPSEETTDFIEDFSRNDEMMKLEKDIYRARKVGDVVNHISEQTAEISKNHSAIEHLSALAKTTLLSKLRLEKEMQVAAIEMRQIEDEKRRATSELEELSIELATVTNSEQANKEALTEAREIIFNIKTSSKRAADLFKDTLAENENQKNKLFQKENECADLETKLEVAINQKNGYSFELDGLSKRMIQLDAEISEKDKTIETLNEHNNALTQEVSAVNTKYIALKEDFAKLEAFIGTSTDEIDNLKRQAELTKRKHHNMTFSLKTEIENIRSQLRLSQTSHKEQIKEVKTLKEKEIRSFRHIETTENDLEKMRIQKDRYSEEIEEINTKLQELNLKYDANIFELQQEQDKNHDLTSRIEKLNEESKKAEGTKIRYEQAIEQNEQLKKLINEYRVSMPDVNSNQVNIDLLTVPNKISNDEEAIAARH